MLTDYVMQAVNDKIDGDWIETKGIKSHNFYNRVECAELGNGDAAFRMDTDAFSSFEYYLGMEYERENIELKIETRDELVVVYESSERVCELFATIQDQVNNQE